jgi:RNA polymerase sigma-70 factor, ECF subfamily
VTAKKFAAADLRAARLRIERDGTVREKAVSDHPRSDAALVRAARAGSESALEDLFHRHWRPAYQAAYLVRLDRDAAEDVAQEAFLAAVRALERFDERRPFGPWLHRIVVNRAIDWTRARSVRREVHAINQADAASEDAYDEGRAEELVLALAELPPEHRAVIVMRYLHDLTPGQIARALGLPRGTVNSRLRRGLDKLSQRLDQEQVR